ncbi:MAG: enolase C-terminal domain-like protein [Candidatus Thermoplasmatota archaeon]
MTLITEAKIRKILDSRGRATVEVEIAGKGFRGRCAAPSGASTGAHEVIALPKEGLEAAMRRFKKEIAPALVGMDAAEQAAIDQRLHEIDRTPDFSRIGGNVATAVSLAAVRAAADALRIPLWRYLGGIIPVEMPCPLGNVIGGGKHALGGTHIQEFLALAQGESFSEGAFANAAVHRAVREIYVERCPSATLGRGDEGAWVLPIEDDEALSLLSDACERAAATTGAEIGIGLDVAASALFSRGVYRYGKLARKPKEQIAYMEKIAGEHGIMVLEDPLHEEDFEGFAELTDRVGDECLIVGDDLFVTNYERLEKGIECGAGNAILVKPNQIGTLTDVLRTVRLAAIGGYETIVSHRSGETTDDTIAHLALAIGSIAIKTGAVGGERTAKLNELIRIEEALHGG